MLATDGLSTLLTTEIVSICMEQAPDGACEIAATLIARTEGKERTHQDNATVVVVRHVADDSADHSADNGAGMEPAWMTAGLAMPTQPTRLSRRRQDKIPTPLRRLARRTSHPVKPLPPRRALRRLDAC